MSRFAERNLVLCFSGIKSNFDPVFLSARAVTARHTRDEGGARRHRRRRGPGCQGRAIQGTCRRLRAEHARQCRARRPLEGDGDALFLRIFFGGFFWPIKNLKAILRQTRAKPTSRLPFCWFITHGSCSTPRACRLRSMLCC